MRPALWLLAAAALGCTKPAPKPMNPQPPVTMPGGLIMQVLREGEGDGAKLNDKLTVHFDGTLLDGGVFDSSRQRGRPFLFWLGQGQVLAGWDQGLWGMKEGEIRKLTVPKELGYGSEAKPKIPANSTLVFEVELLDIR